MRSRIGAALAVTVALFCAASSCSTAGIAYVYMAIDAAGKQHRQLFYTDSSAIYCIAVVSSGRPDVTLDYTLEQIGVYPWCTGSTNLDTNKDDIHPIFAVGEQSPGTGVESVAAEEFIVSGNSAAIPCLGPCIQNLPSGNLCTSDGTELNATQSGTCPATYETSGADSCGIGYTCCNPTVPNNTSTNTTPSVLPYPAGRYNCVVELDGVVAGTTQFDIIYPPANELGQSCPTPPPVQDQPCYNWVPEGSSCVGFEPNTTCNCGTSGLWDCTNNG